MEVYVNREERHKTVQNILSAYNKENITDEEIRHMWNEYVQAAVGKSCIDTSSTNQSIQTVDEIWRNIYDNQ